MIAINKLFKPKSKEIILKDLNGLSPNKLNELFLDAAYNGEPDFISLLLNAGVNVNISNADDDRTALMHAASTGRVDIINLLISNGANVNKKDDSGWTALILASINNYKEIIKLLLEAGADVNLKNNWRKSALNYASKNKSASMVSLLKKYGAMNEELNIFKPKSKDDIESIMNIMDPVELANMGFRQSNHEMVKMAIDKGVHLNQIEFFSSLLKNEINEWNDVIRYYINKQIIDKEYFNALSWSIVLGDLVMIKRILSYDYDYSTQFFKTNKATQLILKCLSNKISLDIFKYIYNHPKIHNIINEDHKKELFKQMVDVYYNDNFLDKILSESMNILKPKSKEEIKNIQTYYGDVLNHMLQIGKSLFGDIGDFLMHNINASSDIQFMYHKNSNLIADNFYKGISPEETANQIMNN